MIYKPRLWLTGGVAWLASAVLLAQNTNLPTFELKIMPTNGSFFISESTNPVFVTITNWTEVTNAFTNITMVGTFGAQTNIKFLDTGAAPDKTKGDGTFSGNVIAPYVTNVQTMTLELVTRAELLPTEPPPETPPPPVVVTNWFDYLILPRPWNDKFTNAYKIAREGGIIIGTNNFASLEGSEPQHAQVPTVCASVWWLWPSPATTNVLVDLGGTSFDAVLAIYTGSSISNLTRVASATNDVVHNLRAHVNFDATIGATYRIAISGYDTNGMGDIRLRIAPGAQPDISGPSVSIASPSGEAIVTSELVQVIGTAKERDVNESGVKQVFLQVNNDTNIVQASGTESWSGVVKLPVGVNLVRAYAVDYDGNRGAAAAVVVRYVNPPNDLFAAAIELTGIGNVVSVNNQYATKEPGEPLHAGNEGGHSVWYTWRAPSTGDLSLSTQGSTFDTLLALYLGNSLTNLLEVASNDDAYTGSGWSQLTQKVVSGQRYYIAIDGLGGAIGNLQLIYSFSTTQPFYQLSVATPLGGTVLPPDNLYEEGTVVMLRAVPDRNFAFVQWQDPSGTLVSSENPLQIVMTRNYSLEAKFRVLNYTDTFSTGDFRKLPWRMGGNAPWTVALAGGTYAARSGVIANGQSTSLILVTNLYAGSGAFDVRVSSESGGDWLEFYLNGARLNRWSGDVPWQTFQFAVPQGANTLEWRYVKDANFSAGQDAAFIDNVYVPLDKPNPPSTGPMVFLTRLANGSPQLSVQGDSGVTYVVQISNNLKFWTTVLTNSSSGGIFQWVDPDPFNQPQRFYRAIAP